MSPTSRTAPDRVTVPSREDTVARVATTVIGGPLGRYATPLVRGWRWYAAALAALSSVAMGLSVTLRGHCIQSGWNTPDQFWHACFSDLPATYKDNGLSNGFGSWLLGGSGAPTLQQPPLTGFVMSLLAAVVPSGDSAGRMLFYFALWAVLAAVLLAVTVWLTTASVPRHPLRAAHVALSPVVVTTLVLAPDIVGVALVAVALWAWRRERLVTAGVFLGLAISARSYPVLVLVALLLVCLRAGRLATWGRTAGAAVLTAGVVLGVFGALNPAGAVAAYRGWWGAGAGFGTPWVIPQLAGYPLPTGAVTGLAIVGWLVAVLVGAVLALSSSRRPGVAELSLVMIAIVLVTGKSMPVQSALWLVPFVALVGMSWRDHLVWAGAEALGFIAVWLYIAGLSVADRGLPPGWYAFFLLVRVAGVLWLVHRTWSVARWRWPDLRDDADARRVAAEERGQVLDPALLAALEAADEAAAFEDEPDELAGPLRGARDQLIVRFG